MAVTSAQYRNGLPENYVDDGAHQRLYVYFGTFTRGFVSTVELTIGNWVPIARFLMENVSSSFGIWIICYRLIIDFGIIAIIKGVFMQEVFRVAATDDDIMIMQRERSARAHSQKMHQLFQAADASGDGSVVWSEFESLIEDPTVTTWLSAQDIPTNDPFWLFHEIAGSPANRTEGPCITAEDMVRGISGIKGFAKAYDLRRFRDEHSKMKHLVEEILDVLSPAGKNTSNR